MRDDTCWAHKVPLLLLLHVYDTVSPLGGLPLLLARYFSAIRLLIRRAMLCHTPL